MVMSEAGIKPAYLYNLIAMVNSLIFQKYVYIPVSIQDKTKFKKIALKTLHL